jgi:xanthine dehydrogenase accessory factor
MSETKSALWIEITATRGSAPRDAGTAMKVTPTTTTGTIGGGALEHRAIATARRILSGAGALHSETIPLGPGLGQCCGGSVTLRYTDQPCATDSPPPFRLPPQDSSTPADTLWIWGAGHVGRAVVACAPAQRLKITWIDSAADRFPPHIPAHVTPLPAADMPRLAARAPQSVHHLIFTYSHDIDLALCAALLQRDAASIGLIGSDTKWARFSRRLRALHLDPAQITCPIGDKSLGKAPPEIAHGVVQSLLAASQHKAPA